MAWKRQPKKHILDPTFRYVPSVETDLRKTFARVRRERRMQERAVAETPQVVPLIKRTR